MPLYAGIDRLQRAGDWIQWGGERLFTDYAFKMPGGKAHFARVEPVEVLVPEGAFYLTTRRGKQFNSIVMKDHDPVQGGQARDDLLVAADDLAGLGLRDGQRAMLSNDVGRVLVTLRAADIRPGVVQAYWPECNVLIGHRVDPRSEEPDYNAVVWIERA